LAWCLRTDRAVGLCMHGLLPPAGVCCSMRCAAACCSCRTLGMHSRSCCCCRCSGMVYNEATGRTLQIGKMTYNKLLKEGYQVSLPLPAVQSMR
jgi:hypothetical protein